MNFHTRFFNVFEGIFIAFDALRANKVRAALSILGIAVGVFVVVIMSAAIHGINASVAKDFEAAGPMSFYVSRFPTGPTSCDGTDEQCAWRHNPPLRIKEANAIERLESVQGVTAQVSTGASAKYRDRTLSSISVDGMSPNWLEVTGGDIAPGRNFTYAENNTGSRVVVINDKLREELFGTLDPIGRMIEVKGAPFLVIGLYHYTASFLSGGDQPKAIIPFVAAQRYLNVSDGWMMFTVKPRESFGRDVAMDDVTAALRSSRGLKPAQDNTFFMTTQEQLFELYNKMTGTFFIVMMVLGAIGLIVGGVGVVAIMMISVTERTREIGVRKALGATRATILWQFLVEAATLTVIGASVGLALGWIATLLVKRFFDASIPPLAILIALVGSALTGVLFGMLPAARAAKLDPIDALRYE